MHVHVKKTKTVLMGGRKKNLNWGSDAKNSTALTAALSVVLGEYLAISWMIDF